MNRDAISPRIGAPAAQDRRAREDAVASLLSATYDGKRLASFRRVLGAFLLVTGAPAMVLSRATDPTIRRAVTVLALLALMMVLPMVRLVCLEWQTARRVEALRALVEAAPR